MSQNDTKSCKECGVEKSLDDFSIDVKSGDGRKHKCKDCCRRAMRLYRQKKKDGIHAKRTMQEELIIITNRLSEAVRERDVELTASLTERLNKIQPKFMIELSATPTNSIRIPSVTKTDERALLYDVTSNVTGVLGQVLDNNKVNFVFYKAKNGPTECLVVLDGISLTPEQKNDCLEVLKRVC